MTWPHPSTHPTTHPPTKPHTHPWVGNSSQISNLQTELKYLDKSKSYRILSDSGGLSPGGWRKGQWEWGWALVCGRVSHVHMHAYTCTRMQARTYMHVKLAKHGCPHVSGHLQFLYMYKCVCVRVCACMCVGHPHVPRCPSTHLPLPRAAGSPKHQNSISPELIEIIRFCLKILYLWTFLNSYRL